MAAWLPARNRSEFWVELSMSKARSDRAKRTKRSRGGGKTLDITVLIDKLLAEQVVLKEGETTRRVTCIRAIIHQLWQKSLAGSLKAHKLYMRYVRFAAAQVKNGSLELRYGPDLLTEEQVLRKHEREP
jgi:hypothetical protein